MNSVLGDFTCSSVSAMLLIGSIFHSDPLNAEPCIPDPCDEGEAPLPKGDLMICTSYFVVSVENELPFSSYPGSSFPSCLSRWKLCFSAEGN